MEIVDYKLPGDKKKKKKKPTLRFELDLPDSTDTSCPEYSYIDLVRQTLKERESKGQNDSLCQNLLEEVEERERDEAKAIAQYFEIKYGATAAGQKRKRKDEVRDLVGAGYGYDENDPFVDDSEAYDEIVPASLTTQHGGFYINKGKLNFRAVSDDSDAGGALSDDSIPLSHHAAKKKKLKFLDSEESGNEFKNGGDMAKKKKKKLKPPKDPEKKKLKVSLNGKDKVPGLKQRTKKMKKSTSLAQKLVAKAKAQQMMNASGASGHTANGVQQLRKSLSGSDTSVFKMKSGELGHLGNNDLAQVAKQATQALMSVGPTKNGGIPLEQNGVATNLTASTKVVSHELPPNLPQMLGDKIESLKKIAQTNEVAGKMKFFSSDVNRILLGIEESAQSLPSKIRQGMYLHLAQHLPCSKDTLVKRVKKLQEDDSDQQLKAPLCKLKAAIDAVMKSQIESYLMECDTNKMEKFPDKAAASTDEDDEGEEKNSETSAEKKRNYAPRRKFKWDDNMRQLLCDVVLIKVNYYDKSKSRLKQNPEEYIKTFLETTIKPLWPKPWMQTRTLFKESRSVHERLTNTCSKQKKASNNKKTPVATSKDVKTAENESTHKPIHPKDDFDTFKKRLSFDVMQDSNMSAPISGHSSKNASPTVSVVKQNPMKTKDPDVTSGGMEMTVSIEGEDFEQSKVKKTSPKASSAIKETSKNWKMLAANDITSKYLTNSSTAVVRSSAQISNNCDNLIGAASTSLSTSSSLDKMPTMDQMQDYASDFLKMMISEQLAASGANAANPYLNSSGIPTFEAMSHLLDHKTDIASSRKSKSPLSDGKFQFKIASNCMSASKGERAQNAFLPMDSNKKHMPSHYNASSWSPQKAPGISGLQSPNPSHKFIASQSLPGRSLASFNDSFSGKAASTNLPEFVMPKFVTQRKQKQVPSSNSSVPSSRFDAESNSRKLNRPSPKNKPAASNSIQIPTSRQPYHHNASHVQSPSHSISPSHPVSPVMLSPYTSSSGMAFSPRLNPQMSPYASSIFKPPSSPVHPFPAVSLHNINYGINSYPQIKLVDVKDIDLTKHRSDNLQGKRDR